MSREFDLISIDNDMYAMLQDMKIAEAWEMHEKEVVDFQLIICGTTHGEKKMSREEAATWNKIFNEKGRLGRWMEKVDAYSRPETELNFPF